MGMKRATVEFQIEAAIEIEVPMGAIRRRSITSIKTC